MGARLNGRPTAPSADINTFSTFYSHHISRWRAGCW
jgi:hypothetical protein